MVLNWIQKTADNILDDMFKMDPNQEVRKDPPKQESITLTLYRGFDADLDNLERLNDNFILSPHKSEQGVMMSKSENHRACPVDEARQQNLSFNKYIGEGFPELTLKESAALSAT